MNRGLKEHKRIRDLIRQAGVAPITPMNRGLKVTVKTGNIDIVCVAPITPMNRGLKDEHLDAV